MMPWIVAAAGQRRPGDLAHQAQPAAAEHQRIAHLGDAGADGARRLAKGGIIAEGGAAEDADAAPVF